MEWFASTLYKPIVAIIGIVMVVIVGIAANTIQVDDDFVVAATTFGGSLKHNKTQLLLPIHSFFNPFAHFQQ